MYWNRKDPASSEKPVTMRQKATSGIWRGRVSAGLRDNGMNSKATAIAMHPYLLRRIFRPLRLIETFSNDFVTREKENGPQKGTKNRREGMRRKHFCD